MANENELLNDVEESSEDSFDFDELEEKLERQLEEDLSDLEFLEEEKEKIGNPDNLGNVIKDVVWEQFINQIAVTAGEDFIRENNGLHLDLRDEAHIQTTENFADGKIATHNTKIDYQKRYNEYKADFQTDPNIKIKMSKKMRYNDETKTYERYDCANETWVEKTRYNEKTKVWEEWDTRAGKWKKKLAEDARKKFDTRKDEQRGSRSFPKDHIISAAEQIRDEEAAAHVDREKRKDFAKKDINLNDLDSSANTSKSDLRMDEWLNSEKDGKKPAERFNIDEEDLRNKDKAAREEYEKMKEDGKKESIKAGKQSQREEAFRIGGKALRAVVMQLLADLVKEIIAKLVKWFKTAKRNLEILLDALKEAIHSFVGKMKTHLINVSNTLFSTVATAIIGPVFGTIKEVWMLLKQGWKSLKDAVNYIKSPENRGKPIGRLMLETGKIVIAGLTGAGAILLGDAVEKCLISIPIIGPTFAFEIPLIGSLANILGIFLGAVVAGIIGAIAINLIDKIIAKQQKAENTEAQINKRNEILNKQSELIWVKQSKLEKTKENISESINERNRQASEVLRQTAEEMKSSLDHIDKSKSNIEKLKKELKK